MAIWYFLSFYEFTIPIALVRVYFDKVNARLQSTHINFYFPFTFDKFNLT